MTDAQFHWLNKKVVDDIADGIAKHVAGEVLADAVALAPQDTGTLARSLTMQQSGKKGTWQVGTGVFYAVFVEFGTAHSPVPPGRTRSGGQRPFLGPALEKARRRYGG